MCSNFKLYFQLSICPFSHSNSKLSIQIFHFIFLIEIDFDFSSINPSPNDCTNFNSIFLFLFIYLKIKFVLRQQILLTSVPEKHTHTKIHVFQIKTYGKYLNENQLTERNIPTAIIFCVFSSRTHTV